MFRFGFINEPSGAPGRHDTQRYTLGLNYWLNATTVLKAAYEFNTVSGATNDNALLLQAAIGF